MCRTKYMLVTFTQLFVMSFLDFDVKLPLPEIRSSFCLSNS